MNAVSHWLAPDVLHNLGLALANFIWQGAAIAALTAALLAVARKASSRYVIAVVALSTMFVAPVVTYFVLQNASSVDSHTSGFAPTAISSASLTAQRAVTRAGQAVSSAPASANLLNWFVALWFSGVLLFSLRTAGGFFVVARLRRRDSHPAEARILALCRELQVRLGITRAVRFCESLHLDAPAVLGWFRPVVFLPVSALTGLSEAQLRAVIAHELAHIRRFDAFVNLFQVAVETLLFYHPAVWWLNKRIRAERENCCDDVALTVCGNAAEYARALALMEEWRLAPSFAMAANRGPLASRVARLLGLSERGSSLRNAGVVFGILCVATAVISANALFGVVRPAAARSLFSFQAPSTQMSSPEMSSGPVITVTAPRPAPQAKPAPSAAPQPPAGPKSQSYIDGMKAEGFDNLDADQLIAMKVQGVTPQYIHEIRAEGLKPSVDDLIGMKVQGITPEYIRQMRALKLDTDVNSLIGLKVQGITPQYIDEIRKMGFPTDADHLIGMKVQGITPEYVDQMRKLGFKPDADQIIGMKVQGITPQYVDDMRKLGFQPDADQIVGMKVQGITPQYVEEMRKLGFKPDADQIVGMKVQGITPEYVKQLNDLGLHPDADEVVGLKVQGINAEYIRSIRATSLNPDTSELIGLKVQGVTADYIKALQAAGFKPSIDDVVGAKVQGVSPEFIKKAQSHGFKNLDLEKIIQLKQAGVLE